jgi:two-component sensor histidine kinase
MPKFKSSPISLLAEISQSFDQAPWAVTELSGDAHLVRYANPAFCRLMNKAPDDVIGVPFEGLLPTSDECVNRLNRVYRTGVPESYIGDDKGGEFPLLYSCHLWPVQADGRTAGVMVQVTETGPLHETRQAISQALLLGALRQDELIETTDLANLQLHSEIRGHKQRELDARSLTHEVVHRVKNNLQVIAALIGLEIRRAQEPCVQGYKVMRDRIMAIAQLYDLMSQSTGSRTVDLDGYVREIAKTLTASLLGSESGIRIIVEAEPLTIDSERAVPFGLLVNELTTNAIKYAFPQGNGTVSLSLRKAGTDIELRIADNGIGVPASEHAITPGKHGSDYVAIFVRQLEGSLSRVSSPGGGTSFNIRFPRTSDRDSPSVDR